MLQHQACYIFIISIKTIARNAVATRKKMNLGHFVSRAKVLLKANFAEITVAPKKMMVHSNIALEL